MHVQSDEKFSFEVFLVSKAKSLAFNLLDKLVGSLQLGIGIRQLKSIDDVSLVFESLRILAWSLVFGS